MVGETSRLHSTGSPQYLPLSIRLLAGAGLVTLGKDLRERLFVKWDF